MSKSQRGTYFLQFAPGEKVPARGDTVIMAGGFGVTYSITIHRIKAKRVTEHGSFLDVDATRRVLTNA